MAGSNGTTATTLRVGAESSAVVGNTPLVALPRLGAELPGRGGREARVLQSRRVGQGPDRRRDDRRRRARRPDRARALGDRRADQRQHRDRPGTGGRRARLPADPHAAGGDEPGAHSAAAHLRRRGPRDALAGRDERGGRARQPARRGARRLHPAAVLEPRQPRDPPPDHRRGDLARPRRAGGRLRRRRRHRRHDHRRRPGASRSAVPTSRSSRVEPAASPVLSGGIAGAAQDPGDRRGVRARGARPRR